ncbi:hypothetical protein AB205_0100300 [Aquarana catesbeiana]|uniref:Uncharacterized protein n=1 Tax=Aquarana catesbeiana TaxID=8400 RepID=A0A2G9S8Y3_AQUCT|nr:hypothetical protein AB205_0100300 [Aquarana catesbeiana]
MLQGQHMYPRLSRMLICKLTKKVSQVLHNAISTTKDLNQGLQLLPFFCLMPSNLQLEQ